MVCSTSQRQQGTISNVCVKREHQRQHQSWVRVILRGFQNSTEIPLIQNKQPFLIILCFCEFNPVSFWPYEKISAEQTPFSDSHQLLGTWKSIEDHSSWPQTVELTEYLLRVGGGGISVPLVSATHRSRWQHSLCKFGSEALRNFTTGISGAIHWLVFKRYEKMKLMWKMNMDLLIKPWKASIWKLLVKTGRQRKYVLIL